MGEQGLVFLLLMGIVGFVAQFVDGTLGMGYGLFSTSLLVAAGLLPVVASASVHTAEIVSTLVSGLSHHRLGNVDRRLVVPLASSGVVGAVAGALLLSNVPGQIIKPYVAGILLIMGILVTWRFVVKNNVLKDTRKKEKGEKDASLPAESSSAFLPEKELSTWKLVIIGFIAASFDAFGGGGWGPITTPTLILNHNTNPHQVVGSVNLAEFFVILAASITFFFAIGPENFDWVIVICLMVGGVIAAPMAAYICRKLPHKWLGILIGGLLILTNLRTLILASIH